MRRRDLLIGLAAALVVAALISPWASLAPDGLEWAAERLGFVERATQASPLGAPMPGYAAPGIRSVGLSTAVSGAVGAILVAALLVGIGTLVRRRSRNGDGGTNAPGAG